MNRPVPSNPTTLDPAQVRLDFPALAQEVNGKPLVYLDNAATSQKPRAVIDAISRYYEHRQRQRPPRRPHAERPRHRGLRRRAREGARLHQRAERRRDHLRARHHRGASTWWRQFVRPARVQRGDEIVISAMEHHSNIVPWQLLCQRTGAKLRVIPMTATGELCLGRIPRALERAHPHRGRHARVELARHREPGRARSIAIAHERGVPVLVDGAQAVPHLPVDVRALDATSTPSRATRCSARRASGVLYGRARAARDACRPTRAAAT